MPSRTVNLKLVLGKKEAAAELRRTLWTTHHEVNKAVERIERMLLLCRAAAYRTLGRDGEEVAVPEGEVVAQALTMAREAQKRNGKVGTGSDEDILRALRQLYEQMVPSCLLDEKGNPLKGDAQSIGGSYAGPVFDPGTCIVKENKDKESCGPFAETASKMICDLPAWITKIDEGNFDKNDKVSYVKHKNAEGIVSFYRINLKDATVWYESNVIQEWISNNKAFNKDGWKKKKESNDDTWAADFARKQMELAEDPRIAIRSELWERLGLLPLGDLFFDKKRVGNLWNRLAMRLAVAHLLSWESWNHSTKTAHEKAKADRDGLGEECKKFEEQFKELRQYETERHQELKRIAFADDERPFKIGTRAIRAWSRVRELWLNKGNSTDARKKILIDLQTRLRGKFGDPDLFLWLAEEAQEHLWKEADILTPLVQLNVAQRILEKRKPYALMTFADARLHPRWAMFEAPGGTNLRNYDVENRNGRLYLELDLLQQTEGCTLAEKKFSMPLAPSGQLSDLELSKDGKRMRLKYRSGHQDFEGVLGGAEILFHRPHLEHPDRSVEAIADGAIGPVWLKLTLDVQSKAPGEWLDGRGQVATPPEVHHFKTALSNKSKHTDKLQPGLRVLSVDLGLRTFASCSVFELVRGKPETGFSFPASDDRDKDDPKKLWAKHERSFRLPLPGETPTKREEDARKAARDEIRGLKQDVGRLKDILRLGVAEEDATRDERIKALMESLDDPAAVTALSREIFEGLNNGTFRSTLELWQQCCQHIYDEAEELVSQRFSEWRKRTRSKSASWRDWRERRSYAGGKSIWMLEYLEAVRKLIISWNLRGRAYGEVNREDKKARGSIASRLLHHINNLKEDRVKAGADLIIQAARGYIPRKNSIGWEKRFEPCRVILFEDLARYRFRVDRPRRENSQLMKWNHREIVRESTMQAGLYGILVETTAAGFSSRYLASTGAPGVRCRRLTEDDFEDGLPKPYVVFELEWMLGNSKPKEFTEKQKALQAKIKPGMWVPWSGGEMFATLEDDGKTHSVHADINAAQNLQRRLWNRCGEAFRITCKADTLDGVQCYVLERTPGARLLGALQQMEYGDGLFYLKDESGNNHYVMKPSGGRKTKMAAGNEDAATEDALAEALVDLDEDLDSGRETFFRDPSGILFGSKYWIPSKQYWGQVKTKVWGALRNQREDI